MTWWDRWTEAVACVTGARWTFLVNVLLVLVWMGAGPFYGFSDTWQLWANTATTLVTYLMVFIIQHTQNKADAATQVKLDELVRRLPGPRNELAGIDRKGEAIIKRVRDEVETD